MPGEYETLIYDRDGTRGRITLNRPELLNAVAMTRAPLAGGPLRRLADL